MSTPTILDKDAACSYLGIDEKAFTNYISTGEIVPEPRTGYGRFQFNINELNRWKNQKTSRIVYLTRDEYETCFEFAIQMAYSKVSSMGTFSRVRTEPEVADNFISGIMAEFGLKKFLKQKFDIDIELDLNAHPGKGITEQDIVSVDGRPPKLKVAVKSSKEKSCWNVIPPREYEDSTRNSDVYVFARSLLPSDHLFRLLKNDYFFARASQKLQDLVVKQNQKLDVIRNSISKYKLQIDENKNKSKEITKSKVRNAEALRKKLAEENKRLKKNIEDSEKEYRANDEFKQIQDFSTSIPVWICGYNNHGELHEVLEIPGQTFDNGGNNAEPSYRYVVPVSELLTSDNDWQNFANRL